MQKCLSSTFIFIYYLYRSLIYCVCCTVDGLSDTRFHFDATNIGQTHFLPQNAFWNGACEMISVTKGVKAFNEVIYTRRLKLQRYGVCEMVFITRRIALHILRRSCLFITGRQRLNSIARIKITLSLYYGVAKAQ